jgi:outer membrane protein assembly factor BamA
MEWRQEPKGVLTSEIFSSKNVLIATADSLKKTLHDRGFLLLSTQEISRPDTVLIKIDSGPIHKWKELNTKSIPEEWLKKLNVPGNTFSEPYLWMERLIGICENSGYPFASVELENFKIENNNLFGIFRFNEGPKILWDSLEISGLTKTNKKFLQRYSGITPGGVFSQTEFEKAIKKM